MFLNSLITTMINILICLRIYCITINLRRFFRSCQPAYRSPTVCHSAIGRCSSCRWSRCICRSRGRCRFWIVLRRWCCWFPCRHLGLVRQGRAGQWWIHCRLIDRTGTIGWVAPRCWLWYLPVEEDQAHSTYPLRLAGPIQEVILFHCQSFGCQTSFHVHPLERSFLGTQHSHLAFEQHVKTIGDRVRAIVGLDERAGCTARLKGSIAARKLLYSPGW